jgi:hypothetical protein
MVPSCRAAVDHFHDELKPGRRNRAGPGVFDSVVLLNVSGADSMVCRHACIAVVLLSAWSINLATAGDAPAADSMPGSLVLRPARDLGQAQLDRFPRIRHRSKSLHELLGRVIDAETGIPVNGAIARIVENSTRAAPSIDGWFKIAGVRRARGTVRVERSDYEITETRYAVHPDSMSATILVRLLRQRAPSPRPVPLLPVDLVVHVSHAERSIPRAGVFVRLEDVEREVITDTSGTARFDRVTVGDHLMSVDVTGLGVGRMRFHVDADGGSPRTISVHVLEDALILSGDIMYGRNGTPCMSVCHGPGRFR